MPRNDSGLSTANDSRVPKRSTDQKRKFFSTRWEDGIRRKNTPNPNEMALSVLPRIDDSREWRRERNSYFEFVRTRCGEKKKFPKQFLVPLWNIRTTAEHFSFGFCLAPLRCSDNFPYKCMRVTVTAMATASTAATKWAQLMSSRWRRSLSRPPKIQQKEEKNRRRRRYQARENWIEKVAEQLRGIRGGFTWFTFAWWDLF